MKYFLFIISLILLVSCSIGIPYHKEEANNRITTITFSGESNQSLIKLELNWIPRTLSGVSYIFGEWNPKETDKSIQELKEIFVNFHTEQKNDCSKIPYYESLYSTYNSDMNPVYTGNIIRMTPEIEYLAYTFLSDSLIKESSVKCADVFWKNGEEWAPIYNTGWMHEDMGEIIPENWWNPYNININKLIYINNLTWRKELNIDPIWTLRTQISFPSVGSGIINGNYTNPKLIECLQKNNILIPFQRHVNFYYDRFMELWRWINTTNNNPQ